MHRWKQLHQATFPSSSFQGCPGTSWFPGTPFTDLWRETIHSRVRSRTKWQEVRETKSNGFWLWTSWAPAPPNGEEGSPLPWFVSCYLLLPLRTFCELRRREEREGETRGPHTPLSELEKYPFHSVSWNQRASPGASLSAPRVHPNLHLALSQGQETPEGKQ